VAKQTITYEPQVLDLVLYAGDGASFRLVVTDSVGAPLDLTGTMLAQVRSKRDEPDPPDAIFGVDLSEHAAGIATLSLTGEETQALAPVTKYSGEWDLQWTATGKEPVTICQGKVDVNPDVSR
jgi:hypothetical protein